MEVVEPVPDTGTIIAPNAVPIVPFIKEKLFIKHQGFVKANQSHFLPVLLNLLFLADLFM